MKLKKELTWALTLFLATILWMVFEKFMGWHDEKIDLHPKYSMLYDVVFLMVFALAFWEYKKSIGGGGLSWKQGFRFGMTITILVAALSPLVQLVIHKLISPEFFSNIINHSVESEFLTQAQAESSFNLTSYTIQNLIGTILLGTILSALLALIFKKPRMDEVNSTANSNAKPNKACNQ